MSNLHLSAPAPPPRFQVIAAMRKGANYVLRDNLGGFDYPFKTLRSAVKAIDFCRAQERLPHQTLKPAPRFASSPSDADAYMASGPILESFVA